MKNNQIEFQIIDILSDDIQINENNKWDKEFVITFYGKTSDNQNIICNIKNYKPYFYLRIPDNWAISYIKDVLKIINIRNYALRLISFSPWEEIRLASGC